MTICAYCEVSFERGTRVRLGGVEVGVCLACAAEVKTFVRGTLVGVARAALRQTAPAAFAAAKQAYQAAQASRHEARED